MPCLLYPPEGDPVPIVKVGVWVGMGAGLDGSRKSHLRPGFKPWTVQPVASDIPTTLVGICLCTLLLISLLVCNVCDTGQGFKCICRC